ncbi:hypothetical protein GGD38_002201 [Chitinophagaceae bacterium OAS944]|nr:hypothetical protein [Chitinophagaceae bacterium OAS944]
MGFPGLINYTNRVCASSRVLDNLENRTEHIRYRIKRGHLEMSGCASTVSNIISNKYKAKPFLQLVKCY